MVRKPKPTRKPPAAQSPALVGRGQGEGFGTGSVPALVGRGQARVEDSTHRRPSAVLDTRVIYCGDCLDQLRKLPAAGIDLIYIDPPFNSNRNYEVPRARSIRARAEASGLCPRFQNRRSATSSLTSTLILRTIATGGE